MDLGQYPFYRAFKECVSQKAIKDITILLVGMAKTGNVEAAKLVLQYALALPEESNEDILDDKK